MPKPTAVVTWRDGDPVVTPNGPGVYQGVLSDEPVFCVMVRHRIDKMTGDTAGKKMTPNAKVGGIWGYKPEEVSKG